MSVTHPLLKILKVALLELYNEGGKIYDTNLNLVPFCRALEDIFRLGLQRNHGHWFTKADYWTVFIKFGDKAGPGLFHLIKFVKDNQKAMTDQGRGRLFIRACLVKKDLASLVQKLRDDTAFIEMWYDSTSILRDDILSEIFLSLLAEVQNIPFSLYLKNASFLDTTWDMAEYRDYEFVPCNVLGVHLHYVDTHLVVTDVDAESVAAEDGKISVGDVMDELYTESLRGAKRGKVRDLFQLYKGMPVYVSFVKARLPNGEIYRPIAQLLREVDIDLSHMPIKGEPPADNSVYRKPAHAVLPEEEKDEIPVHGPDGKAEFTVVYRGFYPLAEDGRVDRIHDSIENVITDSGRRKEVVKIETTETGVEVRRLSDNELLLNHSYTEVSACGRRTDMLLYFGYIAGETTCNMAKDFKCYVFESEEASEAKIILCSIGEY
ncbi:uncharacterized protein LOC101860264 [Aplysia californica]|uniref:Uncharacterized protein LOC101860264 n=1 Tax=Aplysia californica TaxID=6500 RepID=A0ABM1VWF9_APLCA|nr:uncharacterized protein LOC101860264 [Aplysia californica]XP_035826751.1 uncharacterized protein LOC101860264 [Aplysia californica]